MATIVNLPVIGLQTSRNPFSVQVAPGSMQRAENVFFSSLGVLSCRPGLEPQPQCTFGPSGSVPVKIVFYGDDILVQYLSGSSQNFVSRRNRSSSFDFLDLSGTYNPPGFDAVASPVLSPIRFNAAARDLFFITDSGSFMVSGPTAQPVPAGMPQGLSLSAVNNSGSGWQAGNTAVAYRYTLCSKDSFGRIIEGPPSGRLVLRNQLRVDPGFLIHNSGTIVVATAVNGTQTPHYLVPGDLVSIDPGIDSGSFNSGSFSVISTGSDYSFTYDDGKPTLFSVFNTVQQNFKIARSADVSASLPFDATTDDFLRFYRSQVSLEGDYVPGDDMRLCYESAYLTDANLSTGSLSGTFGFHDTAPEGLLGLPLYTSPSIGEGADQGNFRPPLCQDATFFADRMWYANTTSKHSLVFSLVGTGLPRGLMDGDALTFLFPDGNESIFVATGSIGTNDGTQFQLFTDQDPGLNIQRTAHSLVGIINSSQLAQNQRLEAFYVSGDTDAPGRVYVVSKKLGDESSFQMFFDGFPDAFSPQPPDIFSRLWPAPASSNDRAPARLAYSKLGQPESVPPVDFLSVDSDTSEILRIMPCNYLLYVFKTDGIYYVTPDFPFSVKKISEIRLIAPETVCTIGNFLYALTDHGYVLVADGQVTPFSQDIDADLEQRYGSSLDNLRVNSVSVGSSIDQQMVSWIPASGSGYAEKAYVFNAKSNGFTNYMYGATCAAVDPQTERLWIGQPYQTRLLAERNDRIVSDAEGGILPGHYELDNRDADYTIRVLGTSGTIPYTFSSSSFDGRSIVMNQSVSGTQIGDGISQLQTSLGYLRTVVTQVSGNTLITRDAVSWSPSAALQTYNNIHDGQTWNVRVDATSSICVGDLIFLTASHSPSVKANGYVVTSFSGTYLSVAGVADFIPSTLFVHRSIPVVVELNRTTQGNPSSLKMFQAANVLFTHNSAYQTEAYFRTESGPVEARVVIQNVDFSALRSGTMPYPIIEPQLRRIEPLPLDSANCAQLTMGIRIRQADAGFRYVGSTLVVDPDSETNDG